jgi:hypothetical protein
LWTQESVRRYYLIATLLDTAVKIAYVGCSAGWLAEKTGEARGLFVMLFEPIEAAMRRVDHLMNRDEQGGKHAG